MFGKKKSTVSSSANSQLKRTSHTPSIISEDVRLTGSLVSQGEVQLDGRIDGDVRVNHLVIGNTGCVEGSVVAESVIVKGKVIGSLNASKVVIERSAQVHGDVYQDTLSIDAGAIIEGNLKQRHEAETVELITNNAESKPELTSALSEGDNDLSFFNKQAAEKK
ncbi:polymer-forming cytoskeletal protein [Pseudoalteromonas sp. SR44-5]|uniref:Polymer-forming cytoskeletal protein n=2 Tax=Pseudoalteromonas TaxID=53246 RepID=A0ABY3FDT2_9GAMM|nr:MULTISPECIES: polymer-forming cytoskeletal protein [Pseudoalteromonas]MBB1295296.1 polymer-forming cytoskeletal protein [Pseudoalteromonas sp. SR41-4]MBB1300665.1 polymer-forming cytoskeletal protein [Pseudoalteromonas sp. SR44-8]MBB1332727.1 polymer-forming cytoskeletal protein [Pseudoalteromonas sp. SR41-6]MBB1340466.1 polymer-forming cytoskeletal protein [Pseudoalteromonas sp. SR45-6]MBB1364906.1 polymer-forming cytoskeletal protein [Pseudoalteromonas sp. SR44-5]